MKKSLTHDIQDIHYSALTIDVEDGINILMRDLFHTDIPPTPRVIDNVKILLNLFKKNGVRGTFFVLGEIAETYPSLIHEIALCGHELGVHGYFHNQIFKLTPKQAKEDIYKAKALIEDLTGEKVYGFRAPAFSIMEQTKWVLEILSELEFKYDSSIVPAKAKRYGWPGFSKEMHRLLLSNGKSLIEVPLSVVDIMGIAIPACGGGYLRYLPYPLTLQAFKIIQKNRPVIVYLHPYEIDINKYPDFFYDAMNVFSLKKKISISCYRINKGTVKKKLENLIKRFPFKPIIDIIDEYENHSKMPIKNCNIE